MPMANVFESDIFSLQSLTATVNKQPVVPGRIGQLGLFQESGVTTTTVSIESKQGKLKLVKNEVRGANGQITDREDRKVIPFNCLHLPQQDAVMADEVQNVRAFGTEDQLQPIQELINNKTNSMRQNLDATMEHHRMGAIKGQVVDADGSTVLHDMFTSFGITQSTANVAHSAASFNMLNSSREWRRKAKKQLGNVMVPRWRALCGKDYFNELVDAEETRIAWERYNTGAALRDDQMGGFKFADIFWEEYADELEINGADVPLIADDEAYLIPEGVNGLFITRFAPANLMQTVNSMGIPYYSHIEPIGERGVNLFVQSNPLHLCTVPGAITKLKAV